MLAPSSKMNRCPGASIGLDFDDVPGVEEGRMPLRLNLKVFLRYVLGPVTSGGVQEPTTALRGSLGIGI
eukprot:2159134-Rhodomonas_salina.1